MIFFNKIVIFKGFWEGLGKVWRGFWEGLGRGWELLAALGASQRCFNYFCGISGLFGPFLQVLG